MSAEALIQLSSLSTFPIPVDYISSACKAEEIVFNGVRHTTISGTKKILLEQFCYLPIKVLLRVIGIYIINCFFQKISFLICLVL